MIAYNVVKTGAQYEIVKERFSTLADRLRNDVDCFEWMTSGLLGAFIADPRLFGDVINRIGVASRFEKDGNNTPGITALADVSPAWDIIINAQGAFFYGGNIVGIGSTISASSVNGQVFVLLYELAHVVKAGISHEDADPYVNAINNGTIWEHCQKTITGR